LKNSIYRSALALTFLTIAALVAPPAQAQSATQVIQKMNQARFDYWGFAFLPLAPSPQLTAAAKRLAQDHAANNFSSHTGSDGSKPQQRMNDAGYFGFYYAENIGSAWAVGGEPWSDAQMMDWWMNSPGHRANILNPMIREVGVAVVDVVSGDGTKKRYWVVDFGAR
jgi:uncharacterized protein YkwD